VTLDRQSIEKRDFPIARRGYDPAGVDAHLARIADDLDQLRRENDRAATGGVANNASSHVQAIVEAAESTSEQLLREAQSEAVELRERAAADAQRSRQEALEESREHVSKVGEQTTRMLQRVEAMDNELGGMIENLRTGVNRLVADLALLEGNIADLHEQHGGVAPVTTAAWSNSSSLVDEPAADPVPEPATDAEVTRSAAVIAPKADDSLADADELDEDDDPADEAADARDQEASARLIALDLALGGSGRAEVKEELQALFTLADVDRLLDDVFTSIDA
jgi:DivIVA domain-containing protein